MTDLIGELVAHGGEAEREVADLIFNWFNNFDPEEMANCLAAFAALAKAKEQQ